MTIAGWLGYLIRVSRKVSRNLKGTMALSKEELENSCTCTPSVLENADPKNWKEHMFGISTERWKILSDQAFWITGAGTGYGRSMAGALAASGAKVFLTGRRIEKLEESLSEIREVFGIDTEKCYLIPADLRREEEILRACERIRGLCESLSGLVNNAAVPSKPGSMYPLQNDTLEDWQKTIDTNVTAPWLLTKSILTHMLKDSKIRVLFITSEAGWADTAGFGIYNLSKAALNSLGHSMAREYAVHYPKDDIQINVVSPGEARTEMNQGSTTSPYSIVSVVLHLLSHPAGGPNGRFFHRDGRHLEFCYTKPYARQLF